MAKPPRSSSVVVAPFPVAAAPAAIMRLIAFVPAGQGVLLLDAELALLPPPPPPPPSPPPDTAIYVAHKVA